MYSIQNFIPAYKSSYPRMHLGKKPTAHLHRGAAVAQRKSDDKINEKNIY
jgi:hypothetical protein